MKSKAPRASSSPLSDLAARVLSADAAAAATTLDSDADANVVHVSVDADADADAHRDASPQKASRDRVLSLSRPRAIEGIVGAMRMRKRRRQLRWTAGGVFVAAASIVIAIGVGRFRNEKTTTATSAAAPRMTASTSARAPAAAAAASFVRGSPTVLRAGASASTVLAEGSLLEAGDRLVVERGSRATVAFATGTYVALDNEADVILSSAAPAIALDLRAGSVNADVVKLRPNERFVVRTSDTEIEVRGTSFEVSRAVTTPGTEPCGGTATRVKVREGVVAVRSGGVETLVHANEMWPAQCAPREANATAAAARSASAAPSSSPVPPPAGTVIKRPEPLASELEAENNLFESGVAKKREGDAAGAVAVFEQCLARYPNGHFTQSARVERMKLLRGIDRDRARAAARDYLVQHPNGFARSDAELILSSTD